MVELPNGVGELPDLSELEPHRRRCFTYGTWGYWPNRAGLERLAGVRTRERGAISVFGNIPPPLARRVERRAGRRQPRLDWRLPGLRRDWLKVARKGGGIAVVPLWAGAGTKTRPVQLAAMGLGQVVTPEAPAGLDDDIVAALDPVEDPGELLRRALAAGN